VNLYSVSSWNNL